MIDGWMVDRWVNDGWMAGWVNDGWMDGWVNDGWMDAEADCSCSSSFCSWLKLQPCYHCCGGLGEAQRLRTDVWCVWVSCCLRSCVSHRTGLVVGPLPSAVMATAL